MASILDMAPDGIVVINRKGEIRRFNRAAERMFGWEASEIIGKNIKILVPSPYHEQHDGYLANYHKDKKSTVVGQNRELNAVCSDGSSLPIELSVSLISINGQEFFIGVLRNIKKRKEIETQLETARSSLIQSEKMAALGNLVAGIAHEINTPVGIGVTAVTHLREEAERFEETYKQGLMKKRDLENFLNISRTSTEIVESNLVRASQLVRSFKEIAVDQSNDDVREIALLDYVNQIITSLRPKLKNRPILIDMDISSDLRARLNSGAFSQIITNLIMNSLVHAYNEGDKGHIKIEINADKQDMIFSYEDDGKGMDATTVSKVFDPFYTTKRGQGGSGLGMHIVYNIVTQKMGGRIQCVSTPGQGVLFTVRIPKCIENQEL